MQFSFRKAISTTDAISTVEVNEPKVIEETRLREGSKNCCRNGSTPAN